MTVLAPEAIAFVMSPENLMPPSAMIGMLLLFATFAASMIAVIWGTPTPATIRVVHIEPGPTPILTASQPALMRARQPSFVATFPATI